MIICCGRWELGPFSFSSLTFEEYSKNERERKKENILNINQLHTQAIYCISLVKLNEQNLEIVPYLIITLLHRFLLRNSHQD